ncbi:MAG TPA: hypothetical protein VF092_02810 [Longimicrobium sp.]
MQLESLSDNMFAPLSEKEASLVVGGQAAELIGYCYTDTIILWSDGTWSPDQRIRDLIYEVEAAPVAEA